jgi:soluble lytic murein transglycosylase-like protein
MTDRNRMWAILALIVGAVLYGGKKVVDSIARTEREKRYMPLADAVSARLGLDPNILRAIIARESNWTPEAVGKPNRDGTRDYGLVQLNEKTAATLRARLKRTAVDTLPGALLDPETNLLYAEALLREIKGRRYEDASDYFHAWNVGWPAFEKGTRSPYINSYASQFEDYSERTTANA